MVKYIMKRIFFIIMIFVLFGILMFYHPRVIMSLDQQWSDFLQTSIAYENWAGNVYIVAIDDDALNRYGRWPFDRSIMAGLIDKISSCEPAYVGLDIIFAESSSSDETFTSSIFYAGNILGSVLISDNPGKGKNLDELSYFPLFSNSELDTSGFCVHSFVGNVDAISSGFLSRGHFKFNSDFDNVIRHYKPFYFYKDRIIPGMVFEMFREYRGFGIGEVSFEFHKNRIVTPEMAIPVDENSSMLIRYLKEPGDIPTVKMTDIMDGTAGKEFKDGLVLVGMTGTALHDYRATPISPDLPGIEIQATALNNLLTGNFLLPMKPENLHFGLLLMYLLGIVYFLYNKKFSLIRGLLSLAVVFIVHFGLQFYSYGILSQSIPFTIPNLFYISLFGYMLGYYYLISSKGARELKRILSHYLSPNVMQELIKDPSMVKLGGKKYEIAVIFGDVAGFTTFSESHPPEEVVMYLNEILTRLTNCVFKHNGTLDKYIGDCIMAFWGAPMQDENSCSNAVMACIDMIDDIKKFNEGNEEKFHIGVGVNFGDAVVGNMGSEDVYDYTAMGDIVNTASRLEGVTRTLNNCLVINSTVYGKLPQELKERFEKHPEKQKVKGKVEGLTVYTLNGYPLKDV